MICPDCNDSDSYCLNCDGSGHVCDTCGEYAERGASLCESCSAFAQGSRTEESGDHDPLPDHMSIVDADEACHAQD